MNVENKSETLKFNDVNVAVYHSIPEEYSSAVIVIEEIWGLNDHIKDVCNRIAQEGYYVLSPELLADTGVLEKISPEIFKEMADPEKRDEAQKKMRDAIAPISSPEFAEKAVKRLKICFDFLKNKGIEKIGVMGFCFGGTYSFALAVNEPDLKVSIPFYGHPPKKEDIEKINCPVIALYGEKDENLINSLPELEKNMKEAEKDFEYKVYENTGHAFFNNTNEMMYNKEAADDSWEKVLDAFKKYL